MDPLAREQVDEINKIINNLKYGKRFDALVQLNTLIFNIASKEEAAVEYTANSLLDSYQFALNDTFEKPFEEI